jgi:hypothetical protein
MTRSALVAAVLTAGVLAAGCSGSSTTAAFHPYSETVSQPSASPAASAPTSSPSASPKPLHPCKRQARAWLAGGGSHLLHAIHGDLAAYNRTSGKVATVTLHGGNITAADGAWQGALSVFLQDATALQGFPAPRCAGGAKLALAARYWGKAATAYLAAAQALIDRGISAVDSHINTGDDDLSVAKAELRLAVKRSGGVIVNITRSTGT